MTTVTVRIPTPLRSFTSGQDELSAAGENVGDVLHAAGADCPGLLERVLKPDGQTREFVNVYLGSENVRSLQGMDTPVSDGDILSILPAVAGGPR